MVWASPSGFGLRSHAVANQPWLLYRLNAFQMGKEAVGMGLVNQNGKKLSFNPKEITGVQIALHLTKNLCSSKCNA